MTPDRGSEQQPPLENPELGELPRVAPPAQRHTPGLGLAGSPPTVGGDVPPVGPPPGYPPLSHGAATPSPYLDHNTPYRHVPTGRSGSPSKSTLAVVALVAGFVAIIVPVLGGLIAVVLGVAALVQIGRSNKAKTGSALAAEYAGSADLAESPEYPGEDEVFYQAAEECLDIFADYTGTELATHDDLDVFIEYLRSLNWRLNDREVGCFVMDINGRARTGSVRD